MLSRLQQIAVPAARDPGLAPQARAFLEHLRSQAMACRAKPQTQLFEACALLHVCRETSVMAHSEALVRCLQEALGQPVRLLAPEAGNVSFDEAWLVQLAQAAMRDDDASLAFLLRSRVGVGDRRLIGFLTRRVAAAFWRTDAGRDDAVEVASF